MGLQCEFRINIFSYTHLVHLEIQPIQERVIHEDMYNLIYKSNLILCSVIRDPQNKYNTISNELRLRSNKLKKILTITPFIVRNIKQHLTFTKHNFSLLAQTFDLQIHCTFLAHIFKIPCPMSLTPTGNVCAL